MSREEHTMKQQFLRRALGGALSIGLLMQPALAAVTPAYLIIWLLYA